MYTQLNKKTTWVNEQDYILGIGEPGYDTKEHVLKIGNGENKWSELSPALSLAINEFYDGKTRKENIETVFEEETPIVTITYKGEILETLNGGEYITLHTKGRMMEDDLKISITTAIATYATKGH